MTFRHYMESEKEVVETLSQDEIDECFVLHYHLRNVDIIYERVGLNNE